MTEELKAVVHHRRPDPLGYDTRRPFNEWAREMAKDAIAGRYQDAVDAEFEAVMKRWRLPVSVSVYAYEAAEGSGILSYCNSPEEAIAAAKQSRVEMIGNSLEKLPPSSVWAFDMNRPKLNDILAVLNGEQLADRILRNKRLVASVDELTRDVVSAIMGSCVETDEPYKLSDIPDER